MTNLCTARDGLNLSALQRRVNLGRDFAASSGERQEGVSTRIVELAIRVRSHAIAVFVWQESGGTHGN